MLVKIQGHGIWKCFWSEGKVASEGILGPFDYRTGLTSFRGKPKAIKAAHLEAWYGKCSASLSDASVVESSSSEHVRERATSYGEARVSSGFFITKYAKRIGRKRGE